MTLTITSKRQVTFPKHVLDRLGLKPGDRIELVESEGGFELRTSRIDYSMLAPLRGKIRTGLPPFDIARFREEPHDPSLWD